MKQTGSTEKKNQMTNCNCQTEVNISDQVPQSTMDKVL